MNQQDIVELARTVEEDLGRRLDFLLEIDKLKTVLRRSRLVDASRYENSAEHSWHLAMLAMVLAPHAGPDVDLGRAIEILLIHDIVEIDAGDIYIYDTEGRKEKEELERTAADRIFGLLPAAQAEHVWTLWEEYEARETPTARFAYALDRLQPLLLNAASDGMSWTENGIRHSQTVAVNGPIADGAQELWAVASAVLAAAADHRILVDDRPKTVSTTDR